MASLKSIILIGILQLHACVLASDHILIRRRTIAGESKVREISMIEIISKVGVTEDTLDFIAFSTSNQSGVSLESVRFRANNNRLGVCSHRRQDDEVYFHEIDLDGSFADVRPVENKCRIAVEQAERDRNPSDVFVWARRQTSFEIPALDNKAGVWDVIHLDSITSEDDGWKIRLSLQNGDLNRSAVISIRKPWWSAEWMTKESVESLEKWAITGFSVSCILASTFFRFVLQRLRKKPEDNNHLLLQ